MGFARAIVELAPAIHERQMREVRIAGRLAGKARLTIERVEDPALEVEVLAPEGEQAPGLRLGFTGDRVGVRTGQIVVATGLDEPARLTLLYSLRVRGGVEVTPSNPYFNLRDPGARERVLTVRGHQPGFRVRTAQVLAGPFRASVASDGSGDGPAAIRVGIDERAIGERPATRISGSLADPQQRPRRTGDRGAAVRHGGAAPAPPWHRQRLRHRRRRGRSRLDSMSRFPAATLLPIEVHSLAHGQPINAG